MFFLLRPTGRVADDIRILPAAVCIRREAVLRAFFHNHSAVVEPKRGIDMRRRAFAWTEGAARARMHVVALENDAVMPATLKVRVSDRRSKVGLERRDAVGVNGQATRR